MKIFITGQRRSLDSDKLKTILESLVKDDDEIICNIFDGIYSIVPETIKKLPLSLKLSTTQIICKESGNKEYIKTIQDSDIVVNFFHKEDSLLSLTKLECLNSSVKHLMFKI